MRFYSNHREYLVAAIKENRYQVERTDDKMSEEHRVVCRRILRRHCGELDDIDAKAAEKAANLSPGEDILLGIDQRDPHELPILARSINGRG